MNTTSVPDARLFESETKICSRPRSWTHTWISKKYFTLWTTLCGFASTRLSIFNQETKQTTHWGGKRRFLIRSDMKCDDLLNGIIYYSWALEVRRIHKERMSKWPLHPAIYTVLNWWHLFAIFSRKNIRGLRGSRRTRGNERLRNLPWCIHSSKVPCFLSFPHIIQNMLQFTHLCGRYHWSRCGRLAIMTIRASSITGGGTWCVLRLLLTYLLRSSRCNFR